MHGVLWQLTPRDLDGLNAYERVDTGLYRVRFYWYVTPVASPPALVYVARSHPARPAGPGCLTWRARGGARLGSSPGLHRRTCALGLARICAAAQARDCGQAVSAPVLRRVVVRGRVQGVGFRAFVEDEARQRRIAGWVRNRRDGSVEAVFAGSLDEVERITAAVRHGPPGARVDAVEVSQAGDEDLRQRLAGEVFSVLQTI